MRLVAIYVAPTEGVALNHLVGRTFRVGGVRRREVRRAGVRAAFVHRGGLRAEIVHGGGLRVGDAIEPRK